MGSARPARDLNGVPVVVEAGEAQSAVDSNAKTAPTAATAGAGSGR
jgi:hypothetical protein